MIRGRLGSRPRGVSDERICVDGAEEGAIEYGEPVVIIEADRRAGEGLALVLLPAAPSAAPSNSRRNGTVPVLSILGAVVVGSRSVSTDEEARSK